MILTFTFSLNGFSNILSFSQITEKDIDDVQNFVKNELMQILLDKCKREEATFDEMDKLHFFGVYENEPSKFKFLPGDRKLVNGIVQYLNVIMKKDSQSELKCFQVPNNYKMSRKDTKNLSVGVFFATKNDQPKSSASSAILDDTDIMLCGKLNIILELWRNGEFSSASQFSKNHIKVVNTGKKIRADIICVFCEENMKKSKKIIVQCETRNNSTAKYWNFANLKKHLKTHCVQKNGEELPQNSNKPRKSEPFGTANHDGSSISLEKIDESDKSKKINQYNPQETQNTSVEESVEDQVDEYEKILNSQILANNIHQTKKRLSYSEIVEEMNFHLNDETKTIKIIKIAADGRCLFGSLAHQLYDLKVDSNAHSDATDNLRKEIVEYIGEHMSDFEAELNGRVLEKKSRKNIDDMEVERRFIVKFCLPMHRYWGGEESIKAVSIIHKVNIIIFNEDGPFYFPTDFNKDYDRCVVLAYRLSGKSRNHYDSVNEVDEEYLHACVKRLVETKISKSCHENDGTTICINLDDSGV